MAREFQTKFVITGDADGGIRAIRSTEREMAQLNKSFDDGASSSRNLAGETQRTGRELDSLRRHAVGLGAAMAGAFAVRNLIGVADEYSQMASRIRLATESTSEYVMVQQRLEQISRNTYKSLADNSEMFVNSVRPLQELGLATETVLDTTEALSAGLVISGANAQRTTSVIDQFSKAMIRGRLQGDAYNSVIQNAPRLQQALAEGLGVTTRELDRMARAGELTAERVIPALQSQIGTLREELEQMPTSVADAMQVLSNSWSAYLGQANEVYSATGILAGGIETLADNIELVGEVGMVLAAIYGGRVVGALVAAGAAKLQAAQAAHAQAQAEMMATQQATRRTAAELSAARQLQARAVAEAKATAGTNAHTFALENLARASARVTQAQAAHTAATDAQAAAMSRANLAANGLRGALALVGGPGGALMLGAYALYRLTSGMGEASRESAALAAEIISLDTATSDAVASFEELTRAQRELTLQNLASEIDSQASAMETSLGRIKSLTQSLGIPTAGPIQSYRNLNQAITEVREGTREAADLAVVVRDNFAIPERVVRQVVELASNYDTAAITAERLTERQRDLTGALDGATDSINRQNSALEANREEAEKYLSRLQDRLAGMRNPGAVAEARRWIEALDGGAPTELVAGIMDAAVAIEQFQAKTEAQRKAQQAANAAQQEAIRNARQLQQAYNQQAAALETLRREMNPGRAEAAQYAERTQTLTRALASGAMGAAEHAQSLAWVTREYLRAATGAEELEKQQESLIQQYDRHHQKGRQMAADLAMVNQMYRADVIDGAQYERMLAAIREEMRQMAFESDPMAQDMARAWEEAGKRIDETFADAFRGAFDSFGDFSRRLMDGFKRLLAELAYQATLRPIVIQMTAGIGGALGMAGPGQALAGQAGGLGGFGNLGSLVGGNSIGQAFYGVGSYFGGSSAAAGGGIYGQVGGSVSTGGLFAGAGQYANWQYGLAGIGGGLVGGLFGGQHSGALGGIGSAIGMAAGGPIGAAVGSVLGGALGSVFGGSGTSASLRVSTMAEGQMPRGQTGWEHHGRAFERGAFGDVGFAASGTQRLNETLGGQHQEFLQAIVEMDNLLATLARSDTELQAMARAVQGVSISASNADGIIDQLGKRTVAAVSVIDGEFGQFLSGLGDDVEYLVTRAIEAQQALALMGHLSEQLSLRFNETARGALTASDSLAQLMGGIDALAASAEAYYQLTYSETERQAIALRGAYSALQDFTDETGIVVESADGLRYLIEAIDLTSESGRELYAQAMALVPALDVVEQHFGRLREEAEAAARAGEDALRSSYGQFTNQAFGMQVRLLELAGEKTAQLNLQRQRELAQIDESLRPFQERLWQLEDEAEAVANYNRELERAQSQLDSVFANIVQFVDNLRATGQSPGLNLEAAGEQFARQLALAEAGDRAALQSITQYADRYLQAAQEYYASGAIAQQIQQDVIDALEELPNLVSAEQLIADEIREAMERAQQALGGQLEDLADMALAELASLETLMRETERSVDRLITIDSSILSVRDAVVALGVAQDQVAKLERERIAREQQTQQQLQGQRSLALDALTAAGDAMKAVGRTNDIANSLVNILQNNDVWTATNRHMNFGSGRLGNELRGLPAFAKGGVFTDSIVDSPTLFNMGLMGEAGPEAIMPLHRGSDGSLGIRAELPLLPAMPLLGQGDIVEVLHDLRREVAQLREENRRLLEEGNRHASAGVNLAQAGFKRVAENTERSARSGEEMAQQTKLEAMR